MVERVTVRLRPEPKPGGLRWLARLDRRSAEAYAQAVVPLVARIEASLPPQVLANRVVAVHRDPPRIELERWERARRRFRRLVREHAAEAGAALMVDVCDCYGSISAEVVRARLRALGAPSGGIEDAVAILGRFAEHGVRGLPIGPEPSAVLANAVLLAVDETIAAGGWHHLRWVDDIVVFTPGPAEATHVLRRIDGALERLGLRPNPAKTRLIVDPAAIRGAAGRRGSPAGRSG